MSTWCNRQTQLAFLSAVIMKAIRCLWFSPVHPSAWRVAFFPAASFFDVVQSSLTRRGIMRWVRVFRDGNVAAGMKISQNLKNSGLSIHDNGSPADVVNLPSMFSKRVWQSWDQKIPVTWALDRLELMPEIGRARAWGCKETCETESSGRRRSEPELWGDDTAVGGKFSPARKRSGLGGIDTSAGSICG